MKKDTMKLFGFMILITVVVATILLFIVGAIEDNNKKKIAEDKAFMDKIDNAYANFEITLEQFGTDHDEYITEITDKTSINTSIPSNYKKLQEVVNTYEKRVDEIDSDYKFLYDNCYEKFTSYNRKSTNTKCLKYLRYLEQTINNFIEDVKYVNTRIDEYNKWTESYNGSTLALTTYKKVEEIKAKKYTDYVDLDKDGIFLGQIGD